MRTTQEEDFRQCMRRLAATVAVISCRYEQRRFGITITSVTSLSFDPPSVLCCINRGTSICEPLQRARRFSVNLLDQAQVEISKAFSGAFRTEDRFALGVWAETQEGVPYLEGAQASLFCEIDQSHGYAIHDIVMGRVTGSKLSATVSPLIYQNGAYFAGSPIPANAA